MQRRKRPKNASVRRCGIITTDVDILASDNNAYALRSVQLLQEWLHDTYLVIKIGNALGNMTMLQEIVKKKRLAIRYNGLRLKLVKEITIPVIAEFCANKMFHIHHGIGLIPEIANAGKVGVFIPVVNTNDPEKSGTFYRDAKKRWLSYDQVWLSSWEMQQPYNLFILPIVEFAARSAAQTTWPVINSVVVPPNAPSNDDFLIRTLVLLSHSLADIHFKAIFNRIPGINTPLPVPNSKTPRYAAIIYEGRIHYALKAVCHNTMNALVPRGEWDLHIFHSNVNARFVGSIFGGAPGVNLHNVDNKEISVSRYNALMTADDFWRKFERYERVLVFQTDSFFLQQLNPSHLAYDYVGAPWCLERNSVAQQLVNDGHVRGVNKKSVGNGGLSVRNPAAMLRCVNEYHAKEGLGREDLPEDVFFIVCMAALNMNIATPEVAGSFAIEQTPCTQNFQADRDSIINMNTTALHAAWIHSWFQPGEFEKIMTRYETKRAQK